MKLHSVTITGLDDDNDYEEVLKLSKQYPWLEWGVLFSDGRKGTPRYPSAEWITGLVERLKEFPVIGTRPRFAAHLCGKTMRDFVFQTKLDETFSTRWLEGFGIDYMKFDITFGRVQVNFSAQQEKFGTGTMHALSDGWYESYSGNIITQHNVANHWVWEAMQQKETGAIRAHQILHDASGGRGIEPGTWNKPIAGVLNGYAGGINPSNVITTLVELEKIVGDGYIWIDMEGGVRDENGKMNMPAVHQMLKTIAMIGADRRWF